MEATEAQLTRITRDWIKLAGGEPVRVEQIGGAFYGFTTELGALRLQRKYIHTKGVRAEFSQNLDSWYFCLEPTLDHTARPLQDGPDESHWGDRAIERHRP